MSSGSKTLSMIPMRTSSGMGRTVEEEVVVDERGRQADQLRRRDRGRADFAAGGSAVEDLAHNTVASHERRGPGGGGAVGVDQGLRH